MNRQIKFRVWNKPAKCFIQDINNEIATFTLLTLSDYLKEYSISNIDHLIFQQYTGLNDKNGKEIYEGDIVKYKTWTGCHDGTTEEHQTQVQFKDGAYYPRYIDDECEDSWYSFKVYDIEIIGNVFETPHLDENEI